MDITQSLVIDQQNKNLAFVQTVGQVVSKKPVSVNVVAIGF
jgi:hypothetical protein